MFPFQCLFLRPLDIFLTLKYLSLGFDIHSPNWAKILRDPFYFEVQHMPNNIARNMNF